MSDGTENENRRRIDKMEGEFEKSEIRREKDKQIQEEKMEAMKSDLSEKLADFKSVAAGLVASSDRREKEMHRTVADLHKTVADLHKTIMFTAFGVMATVGVAVTLLGLFLRSGGGV